MVSAVALYPVALFGTAPRVVEQALLVLQEETASRGIRLHQVASGYCFASATDLSPWLKKLWPEKKLRYSRAFLEILAIIAYKQPVTRA